MDTNVNDTNNMDTESLKEVMRDRIAEKPQYGWIQDHHIESWIDRVLANEPERALWHVDRLGGFGGSDMGTLIKHLDGRNGDFTTVPQIIAGKLCVAAPSKGDKHTRRGQRMESVVQDFFEKQMEDEGRSIKSLEVLRKSAIEDADNDVYPWMRSSLDEFYEIDGKKVIVDFKAPSTDVITKYRREIERLHAAGEGEFEKNFVPKLSVREGLGMSKLDFDDYIVQLHHYYEDARIKGVDADELWLAVFDYAAAEVAVFKIEIDHDVVAKLTEAGNHFWENYVLTGKIPEPVKHDVVQADDISEEVLEQADMFAASDLSSKQLARKADELKSKLIEAFSSMTKKIPNDGILIGATEIKRERSVDQEAAYDRLCELGFEEHEIDALRKPSTFDTKKLKAGVTDLKLNFGLFMKSVKSGDAKAVSQCVREMRSSLEGMTEKEKGGFDEKKLTKALLSCGDDPSLVEREEIKIGVTRKKSPEKELIAGRMEKEIENMQMFLAEPETNEITPTL